MTIIRNKRARNFTTIPNELINDPDLYWQDLGLVVFLLSKPDSWFIRPDVLAKEKNLRINGIYEILKRLRASGYARLTRYPSGETEWTIYDEPQSENHDEETPHHENPNEAFPREAFPREDNHDVYVNTDKAVKTEEEVKTDTSSQTVINKRRKEDWQKPEDQSTTKPEEPQKAKRGRKTSQLTEFPEKFEVTEEMIEYAINLGLSYDAVKRETENFKNKSLAKGVTHKDWKAAWRYWMSKAIEYKQGATR